MFEQKKVFDCQKMPDEPRNYFFEHTEGSNDCYVAWWVEADEEMEDGTEIWNPVSTWLSDNGAELGEQVIIKHWW